MQHALDVIVPALLALVVYPAATGLLNWYLWWDTPAAWDAFAAAYPKRAKWVRVLRAINPHFHKLAEVWRDKAVRRSTPPAAPPSVGPLAPPVDPVAPALPTPVEPASVLRAVTVSYRPAPPPASDDGNAAAYELARREVAAARVFDPLSRETIVPPEPPAQGGHVEGAAMLGACIVALAASLLFAGCPDWQRPACASPGAYSCVHDQPHYCARTTHELTPIGDEVCSAQGRTCAFNDAGQSFCARLDAAVSE